MPSSYASLQSAMVSLRSVDEAVAFLTDLTTPAELDALKERWRIANMLFEGGKSYRDIAAETGASTTTVARVARFLNDENNHGYQTILKRTARSRRKK